MLETGHLEFWNTITIFEQIIIWRGDMDISFDLGRMAKMLVLATGFLALAACSSEDAVVEDEEEEEEVVEQRPLVEHDADPYPSTYEPLPSQTTVITNVSILDGRGGQIDNGMVLMNDGVVAAIGEAVDVPDGAVVVDGSGRWVTPGIIDVHSHLGVYPTPRGNAHSNGNEATAPATAGVWAEHSVNPQGSGFSRALAGGITTLQILPGSANLFGGRSVVLRNVPSRTVQGMKFPGAPYGLKMACGENPMRVYRERGPSTLMGNVRGYRNAWIEARTYRDAWDRYYQQYEEGEDADAPTQNLAMDTLSGVLRGDILVHNHCYRADEMAIMIDIANEFGYSITAFHHAIESYKIADVLAENNICSAMWADWGGFKLEAFDTIRENAAFVHNAGACAIIHSDSATGIQRLQQEAAKTVADARRAGLDISMADAWTWLSYNPALALGVAEETGSLEVGKRADLILWNGNPFSVYTLADQIYIDGALVFDLHDADYQPESDYRVGMPGQGDTQ